MRRRREIAIQTEGQHPPFSSSIHQFKFPHLSPTTHDDTKEAQTDHGECVLRGGTESTTATF